MRPIFAQVWNFGSYRHLELPLAELGAAIVSGPTGSGKSTIADIVSWICWGTTSKGGGVEDVKSWFADEPTKGILDIELPDGLITITRIRGNGSQNDLFWVEASDPMPDVRGKNMDETQKLLDARLGITAELYSIIGYFAQFSETDRFFTMRPKDRRETAEKIADLSFPVLLAQRASDARKITKKDLELCQSRSDRDTGRLVTLKSQLDSNKASLEAWDVKRGRELTLAKAKAQEWSSALQGQIRAAKAKAEAWEETHSAELTNLAEQSEAFESSKKENMDTATAQLESITAALADLPDLSLKQAELDKMKGEQKADEEAYRKAELQTARLIAERDGLKSQYEKFANAPEICPHCLGKSDNANSAAFLKKTKAEIDALEGKIFRACVHEANEGNVIFARAGCIAKEEQDLSAMSTYLGELQQKLDVYASELDYHETSVDPYAEQLVRLADVTNPHVDAATQLSKQTNPHTSLVEKLTSQENPHKDPLARLQMEVAEQEKVVFNDGQELKRLEHRIASLTTLYELSFALRGELLRTSVKMLENETNRIINEYFDGEFRVEFTLDDDKLGVQLHKGDYEVNYAPLSGGQRRILVVSFFLALRRAAMNRAGVELSLFIGDEMLHGMDPELKVKTYRLFEDLTKDTESVLLIDHEEMLKSLFSTRFEVSINNDESSIDVAS